MRNHATLLACGVLAAAFVVPVILATGPASGAAAVAPAPKGLCSAMTKVADAGEAFLAHPNQVAANRAMLAARVATDMLGENTPAISSLEAQYAEMWAQDVAAMRKDEGSSSSEAKLQMKATVVLERVDADLMKNCAGSADAFKRLIAAEKKANLHSERLAASE